MQVLRPILFNMIDKTIDIKEFINKHFSPGAIEDTADEGHYTTKALLKSLFKIFPQDCIDDYELYEILISLGYTPQKKSGNEFVWCLNENQ